MQTARLKNSQLSTRQCRDATSRVLFKKPSRLARVARARAASAPLSAPAVPVAEPSTADRKLALLKRSGLFGGNTKGAAIERACTVADLREAYRLVHDVYLSTGYISPEPAGMRLRIFETTSETATFVAKVDGKVVGVLSVVGDSPDLGLPSDAAFRAELDERRKSGKRLCEITNQAVAEDYRKSAVSTELMKCAISHAMHAGYDESVASVSPKHNAFYELLNFFPLGSERSYSDKFHDPVVALSMDLKQYYQPPNDLSTTRQFVHSFMTEGNNFLNCVSEWAKQARQHFLNPDLLSQLFVAERNFLAECTPEQLQVLRRHWGQEIFEVVSGNWVSPLNGWLGEILPAVEDLAVPSLESTAAQGDESGFTRQLETMTAGVRDSLTKPFRDLWSWTEGQLDADQSDQALQP